MPAAALRLDPLAYDDYVVVSADVAVRCSPGGTTALASALGLDTSRGTHLRQGDKTGFISRALIGVDDLARGKGTTPWPLITEAKVIAIRRTLECRDVPWLRTRLVELELSEQAAQARRAAGRDHRDAAAMLQAERDLAAVVEEIVALKDVLRRHERGRMA